MSAAGDRVAVASARGHLLAPAVSAVSGREDLARLRYANNLPRVARAAAKCAWFASAVAALVCVVAGTAQVKRGPRTVHGDKELIEKLGRYDPCPCGQTGPSVADDRAALIVSICRQYAAALTDMPADLMFKQCMFERHCRPVPNPPGYWCEPPQPMLVKPG